mmetsp:Transcript_2929/g.3128  ORF Transcript_2929/g.3128 Transcript_2929/m.3128 type:complete len:485 (+) Transcript_2929:38-1492(+)
MNAFKFIFLTLTVFALTVQADFSEKMVGSYTRFYTSESGAAIATNSNPLQNWKDCDPKAATCAMKLPSDFAQGSGRAACYINYGSAIKFDFSSNNDVFNFLSSGSGSLASSWVSLLCGGKSLVSNDFVVIFIYEDSEESSDFDDKTAALFASQMRGFSLFTQDDHAVASLEVETNATNVNVVVKWTIQNPPQASAVSYRPYLKYSGASVFVGSWELTSGDTGAFCDLPSAFSSSDSKFGDTFSFVNTIAYSTFTSTIPAVRGSDPDGNVIDVSKFTLELTAHECNPSSPYGKIQKTYRSDGQIAFNASVNAYSPIATAPQLLTGPLLEEYFNLEGFLYFCNQSNCSDAFTVTFHSFTVNQTVYAKLHVPGSSRTFNATNVTLTDSSNNEIKGGIEFSIVNSDKPGEVIFQVTFRSVYDNARVKVTAEANPPALRMLEETAESTSKVHRSEVSSGVNVTDGGDGDGAGGVGVSVVAAVCLAGWVF